MEIDVYDVQATDEFEGQAERLTKKKRFFSLPAQIKELFSIIGNGQFEGKIIRHVDEPFAGDVYKMRLPNPDAKVGKANGYRVIYLVVTEIRIVVFLTLYYKKEEAEKSDKYISGLIDDCLRGELPE